MKLLGMKEAEAIEHEMVSKSILRGEEKITKLVSLERTTCKFQGRMDGKEY